MLLQDKVIMISGIGPGLGVKLAVEAARAGAAGVAIAARTEQKLIDAELLNQRPDHALALLSSNSDSGFTVSVRVPTEHPLAADAFCRRFATGGGRKRAAGINHLPACDLASFAAAFENAYGVQSPALREQEQPC